MFSNLVLLFTAALSYYCFVLLVRTRLKVEGSFGDIGGILYGPKMRLAILFSIVISQIGFASAYIGTSLQPLRRSSTCLANVYKSSLRKISKLSYVQCLPITRL